MRYLTCVAPAVLASWLLARVLASPSLAIERDAAPERPGTAEAAAPLPFDAAGRWIMTLPAGWQRKVVLTRASADTLELKGGPGLLFNGVYEVRPVADQLVMIEAEDPSQVKYVWQVLNANTLELIEQDTPSGGSYIGATLARHQEWDALPDCTLVECVGALAHGTEAAARTTTDRTHTARKQD